MTDAKPVSDRTPRRRRTAHGRPLATGIQSSKSLPHLINWAEVLPLAILIAVALLLGGSAEPLSDMAIELLSIALICVSLVRLRGDDWRRLAPAFIAAAMLLLIAAIELIPLPFAIWEGLPGRAESAGLLRLLDLPLHARPLSLDPNATVATLIRTLPAVAALFAVGSSSPRSREVWTTMIIAGAAASALLGGLQILGNRQFYLYSVSSYGFLTGLFASKNHASDMLLIGIALIVGQWSTRRENGSAQAIIKLVLLLLLAVATLLTGSRFGIVLLLAEMVIIALVLVVGSEGKRKRATALVGVTLPVAAGSLILLSSSVGRMLDRFATISDDLRPEIWQGTIGAIGHFWPLGAGLGTFVPVYAAQERIAAMPVAIVNHAHNEYLELALELGLLAPLLGAAYVGIMVVAIIRKLRAYGGDYALTAQLVMTVTALFVLLLHSTNEFPLRNLSLMLVFGYLNALVFSVDAVGRSFSGENRDQTARAA